MDAVDLDTLGGDRGAAAEAFRQLLKKGCWLGLVLGLRLELGMSRLGGVLDWLEDLVRR